MANRPTCNGFTHDALTPNGLDSEPWTSLRISTPIPRSTSPSSPANVAGFDRSLLRRPATLHRAISGLHPIIPDDLLTNDANSGRNFLDFPAQSKSTEEDTYYYFGVVRSLGPQEEETAVVRTLDGCDVACSTRGCEGQYRLQVEELVKIGHHFSGEHEGETFVTHAAAECTPATSTAGSRVGSRAPSRAPSRTTTRPPSPVEG